VQDVADERAGRIRRLRQALASSAEHRLVGDFESVARTYRVFLGNDRELQTFLARYNAVGEALRLWTVNNRPAFETFLDEVDRLLHNYLASVGSLRDQTRSLWRKHLPDDAAYDERVRATFADSGFCQFVQKLRNYALHNKLPIARGRLDVVPNEEFTSRVILSRPDLLSWSGWPTPAKQYLANLPDDDIDLAGLVAAYTDIVTHFNDWFGETFAERCEHAFRRVRSMETEIAEALEDLDRSSSEAT
jgi:hypothetical protein